MIAPFIFARGSAAKWFALMVALAVGVGQAAEDGKALFDGATLAGWKPSAFDTQRAVKVEPAFRDGRAAIVLEKSEYLSGLTWVDGAALPRTNYEISLEAMRLEGSDFFCGLTFPVGASACSFIVGGWGGMVVGLSNVDNMDASENETSQGKEFKSNRWYRIRVCVTPEKIEAWIDGEQMVDLVTKDKKSAYASARSSTRCHWGSRRFRRGRRCATCGCGGGESGG